MEKAAPLLVAREEGRGGRGGATCAQTLGNIVVSIVGTGVLGLPYAFRAAGWLAGSLGVAAAAAATFYCMLLPVECRAKVEAEEGAVEEPHDHHCTYGDLGERSFGAVGRYLTELLIVVSQAGGCVAYLVFIGQNLHSVLAARLHSTSTATVIFAIVLPAQVALSFVRSLRSLAPFSIFADACNALAMAIVIKEEAALLDHPFAGRSAFRSGLWGVGFAGGVAVFCFEGFSMTLALEASMAERRKFRWVLAQAFLGITLAYVCFGVCGYLAYGEETRDIITLNLRDGWPAAVVKVGLSIALAFTFPIMMHPIHEIVEAKLRSAGCFQKLCRGAGAAELAALHLSRVLAVAALSVLASFIPAFGAFISLVGSTVCALLSFVLPALFHLGIIGAAASPWRRALDYGILAFGLAFAGYGAVNAAVRH